ncbi:hypothetical protein EZV62_016813 [Acer yangbiense]|uniref:SAM domain-containing protein n=1 Tax=Acer yangbiense TaxID=1000413 RepID=A0A5C7HQ65_9ROSI|nr:hypothetical protein EZV62_016813 [Acer yangbiense]
MSEPRFTITLGRTGQVVKRGGSKRFSDGFLSATKRLRVDESKWSPGGSRFEDSRCNQYDLRLKLIRKRRAEHRKRDLRDNQLKPVQRPANANAFLREHQSKGSRLLRKYPLKEILGDHHLDNSMQKYYPSQTKHGSRIISPGRTLSSSRRRSPPRTPRTFDGVRQLPVIRGADVSRATRVMSNEDFHASRPTPTAQTAKPDALIGRVMPQSSLMGVDLPTVPGLLHSLGLGKYAILFKAEEVDMTALKQMSDKDLKELGVPMSIFSNLLLSTNCKRHGTRWEDGHVVEVVIVENNFSSFFVEITVQRTKEEDSACSSAPYKTTTHVTVKGYIVKNMTYVRTMENICQGYDSIEEID